jgi:hypothetical protein
MEDPGPAIATLKSRLPLSDEEWEQLLSNEAPYLP